MQASQIIRCINKDTSETLLELDKQTGKIVYMAEGWTMKGVITALEANCLKIKHVVVEYHVMGYKEI